MLANKVLLGIATLLVLHATAAALPAADEQLVEKARDYVESGDVSKKVLGLMHVGTTYKGHKAIGVFNVTDGRGKQLPGLFAVKVRVYWSAGDGDRDWTDVYYFFNAKGRFYGLKPADTTAILSQPFALGGLAIELIKGALVDELRKKRDKEELIEIIKKANAKNLTEIIVALGQP